MQPSKVNYSYFGKNLAPQSQSQAQNKGLNQGLRLLQKPQKVRATKNNFILREMQLNNLEEELYCYRKDYFL